MVFPFDFHFALSLFSSHTKKPNGRPSVVVVFSPFYFSHTILNMFFNAPSMLMSGISTEKRRNIKHIMWTFGNFTTVCFALRGPTVFFVAFFLCHRQWNELNGKYVKFSLVWSVDRLMWWIHFVFHVRVCEYVFLCVKRRHVWALVQRSERLFWLLLLSRSENTIQQKWDRPLFEIFRPNFASFISLSSFLSSSPLLISICGSIPN